MQRITEILDKSLAKREPVVLCTVVSATGSTPLKEGAKMLVWSSGKIFGTIGGGNVERQVIEDALRVLAAGQPLLNEYNLLEQEMCCGGTMQIFIEPMKPQKQLLIFGAGHVGGHVAYFGQKLDFKVVLIDERSDILEKVEAGDAEKILFPHRDAFSRLAFDADTFIVITTHLHEYDREILAHCIRQPHAYLGMIGSRRKVLITRKRFLEQNVCSEEELDNVDMPMGFDLGRNSPAEIALGIVAKILAVANGRDLNEGLNSFDYAASDRNSNRRG